MYLKTTIFEEEKTSMYWRTCMPLWGIIPVFHKDSPLDLCYCSPLKYLGKGTPNENGKGKQHINILIITVNYEFKQFNIQCTCTCTCTCNWYIVSIPMNSYNVMNITYRIIPNNTVNYELKQFNMQCNWYLFLWTAKKKNQYACIKTP